MPVPPRQRIPPNARTSALAVWSLVLGILGICSGITAPFAIVTGHLAHGRIARSSGRLTGKGLAVTGFILGYLGILLSIGILTLQIQSKKFFETMKEMDTVETRATATPIPEFPEIPLFDRLEPSEVQVCQFSLTPDERATAGTGMSFRIYLPAAEAAPQSLPCVLIAPAGTNLLSGADLDDLDEFSYHDETLPYAEAGFAVVLYSIDGPDRSEQASGDDESATVDAMKDAYVDFKNAGAGVVNGRNALELALARLPMVDPDRIYSAGHSSAGTLSLLFAAHEPRLAGCIAYAPAVDIEEHFADLLSGFEASFLLPGFPRFAEDTSPLNHTDSLTAPVFLFFAEDDSLISPEQAEPFVTQLRATNPDVTVKTVDSGGHYQPMIDEGIPAGIEWIRERSRP